MKTEVSSSIPCGSISWKKTSPRPAETMYAPSTAMFAPLAKSMGITGMPSRIPENRASQEMKKLFVHTRKAKSRAGAER